MIAADEKPSDTISPTLTRPPHPTFLADYLVSFVGASAPAPSDDCSRQPAPPCTRFILTLFPFPHR